MKDLCRGRTQSLRLQSILCILPAFLPPPPPTPHPAKALSRIAWDLRAKATRTYPEHAGQANPRHLHRVRFLCCGPRGGLPRAPLSLQCPPSRQKGEQSPKRLVQSASGPPLPSYTPLLATPPLVPASSLFSPPRLHRWLGGKKLSLAGGLRRKRAKRWVSAHSRALGSHTLHKHSTPGSHVGPLLPPPDPGLAAKDLLQTADQCRDPTPEPSRRSMEWTDRF